jgi:hypothetical protein
LTTTTKPSAAADAGALPQLRELASASRQATELHWEREQAQRIARQRNKAVDDAIHNVKSSFPNTLGKLLTEGHIGFTGYPEPDEMPGGPCAVAYLGEDVWLHHTEVRDTYSMVVRGRATLLIPCRCGRYREVRVDDEYALARELEFMDANRDVCVGMCTPFGGPDDGSNDDEDV